MHVHDNVIIPCGDADNSSTRTYSTFRGVYAVEGDHLHINDIAASYDGSTVTCFAGGREMGSYTMEVSCKL